jgi:hypothetical protein
MKKFFFIAMLLTIAITSSAKFQDTTADGAAATTDEKLDNIAPIQKTQNLANPDNPEAISSNDPSAATEDVLPEKISSTETTKTPATAITAVAEFPEPKIAATVEPLPDAASTEKTFAPADLKKLSDWLKNEIREQSRQTFKEIVGQVTQGFPESTTDQLEKVLLEPIKQNKTKNLDVKFENKKTDPTLAAANKSEIFATEDSELKMAEEPAAAVDSKPEEFDIDDTRVAANPATIKNASDEEIPNRFKVSAAKLAGKHKFYVGPAEADKSLSSVTVEGIKGKKTIKLNATVAGEGKATRVNGISSKEPSPIKGKPISKITLAGEEKTPAVTLSDTAIEVDPEDEEAAETDAAKTGKNIFWLTKDDGTEILETTKNSLRDGSHENDDGKGNSITRPIRALAATPEKTPRFFAAVADGSKTAGAIKLFTEGDDADEKTKIKALVAAALDKVSADIGTSSGNGEKAAIALKGSDDIKDAIQDIVFEAYYKSDALGQKSLAAKLAALAKIRHPEKLLGKITGDAKPTTLSDLTDKIDVAKILAAAQKDSVDAAAAAAGADTSLSSKKEEAAAAAINAALGWGISSLIKEADESKVIKKDTEKKWKSRVNEQEDPDDSTWTQRADGVHRGIAVVKGDPAKPSEGLQQQKQMEINKDKKLTGPVNSVMRAARLDTTARDDGKAIDHKATAEALGQIGFYAGGDPASISRAIIGDKVDLHWDDYLQRLFIGLSNVTRGSEIGVATDRSGGVCSVLVGQFGTKTTPADETNELQIHPIVKDASSLHFEDNLFKKDDGTDPEANHIQKYILGFYQPNNKAEQLYATARKVRTMHTSTGHDYLVLNGGVAKEVAGVEKVAHKMAAIPLCKKDPDPTVHKSEDGFVAPVTRKNDELATITKISFDKAIDANENVFAKVFAKVKEILEEGTNGVIKKLNAKNEAKAAAIAIKDDDATLNAITSLAVRNAYHNSETNRNRDDAATAAGKILTAEADDTTIAGLLAKAVEAVNKNQDDIDKWISVDKFTKVTKNSNKIGTDDRIKSAAATAIANVFDAISADDTDGKIKQDDPIHGAAIAIEAGLACGLRALFKETDGARPDTGSTDPGKVLVDTPKHMTLSTDQFAQIGGKEDGDGVKENFLWLHKDSKLKISDVQVIGDEVYIAANGYSDDDDSYGNRDKDHKFESGIFKSRAIFNAEDGAVRAWTPWQRVMGSVDPIKFFGFDRESGCFYYVTNREKTGDVNDSSNFNIVKATRWGLGDDFLHETSFDPEMAEDEDEPSTKTDGRLANVIDAAFVDIGGVISLTDFDAYTHGFKGSADKTPSFSMMVATGQGRVALIETGRFDSDVLKPTKTFEKQIESGADMPVHIIDTTTDAGKALGELGAITCAEVSRIPLESGTDEKHNGWLFVGGQNGVAVLAQEHGSGAAAVGRGWPTKKGEGLAQLMSSSSATNFPGGNKWRFLQIMDVAGTNKFQDVRKLTSDQNKFLYVLTRDSLHRLDLNEHSFNREDSKPFQCRVSQAHGTAKSIQPLLNLKNLSVPATTFKKADDSGIDTAEKITDTDELFDMMIINRKNNSKETVLALATTKGLFVCDQFNEKETDFPKKWKRVTKSDDSDLPLGPVLSMEFFSTEPGGRFRDAGSSTLVADGNLYAYAFEKPKRDDWKELCCFQFDVKGNAADTKNKVQAVKNPFGGESYLYKIGEFDAAVGNEIEFSGPLDFSPSSKNLLGSKSGFAESIEVLPNPDKFKSDQLINLEQTLSLPLYMSKQVLNTASGATYIPGEFGVRVNE